MPSHLAAFLPTDICTRKPQVKNATVPLICHMSPYDGNDCRAAGDLWYYDLANKSCKMLTTGSCSSGSNRFHTIAKCQQICEPRTGPVEAVCLKQPVAGMCSLVSHAWYFDRSSQNCKMFSYTSCLKRHNFFLSEMKCQSVCLPQRAPKPFCSQQPVSTFCTGQANHWYFDENKNTCLVFLKKRCGKPNNRFNTFAQCMNRCSYVTS
nr:amblin-like isoform X2 [Dermacentor andersoni]